MIIEFSVGNYRSFQNQMTLSMLAANLKARNEQIDKNNVFICNDLETLRSAVVFGANASGKSNLVRAMGFFKNFIVESSKDHQTGEPIEIEPFLLSEKTKNKASFFQIIFLHEGVTYRYGFEITIEEVKSEWLYRTVKREVPVFTREGSKFEISGIFKEGIGLETRTRKNALFLSVVAQFNGKLSAQLVNWIWLNFNVISGIRDQIYSKYTSRRCQKDECFLKKVVSFIKLADMGIEGISIENLSITDSGISDELQVLIARTVSEISKKEINISEMKRPRIKTTHSVYNADMKHSGSIDFDLDDQESEGTKKFFNISGPIIDTLENGKVLVIDEMDTRLHPALTEAIIHLFNNPATNEKNAQLIFATHCSHFLSSKYFRRDQIWFTEKNKYGATDLYALSELKVRNDDSFGKHYLEGRYGAIPYVSGLASFSTSEMKEKENNCDAETER